MENEFAKNRRYRPEQVYHGCGVHQAVVTVVRVPNDLTDLEMFLGYKVTAEDRALFRKHPFYATAKVIQGERFAWIWREGASVYLKEQGAKPNWWTCDEQAGPRLIRNRDIPLLKSRARGLFLRKDHKGEDFMERLGMKWTTPRSSRTLVMICL